MNRRKSRGFTLIELMIVVAILGLSVTSIYTLRTENRLAGQDNLLRQKAVWALQSQAAIVMDRAYRDLVPAAKTPFSDELGPDLNITRSVTSMTVEPAGDGCKRIILTVTWQDTRLRDRELSLTLYRYEK